MRSVLLFLVVGGALMMVVAADRAWASDLFCDYHDCSDWPARWNQAVDGGAEGDFVQGHRVVFMGRGGQEVAEQEET